MKRAQFKVTGKYDVLSAGWTQDLLERLWKSPENEVHCELHALYFGDVLAAIDFGLTDGHIYHSWIVAYDNAVAAYSPGIQLLEGLIDHSYRYTEKQKLWAKTKCLTCLENCAAVIRKSRIVTPVLQAVQRP